MKKNIIEALSVYFEEHCKERQEALMQHWTQPIVDHEFYDIINACFTHRSGEVR